MPQTVYKSTLAPGRADTFNMPEGATIVEVNIQNGLVAFWYVTDPSYIHTTGRTFVAAATGQVLPDNLEYVGTAVDNERGLVWHLFEEVVL